MSEYVIKRLDVSTWDAFARLAEKHNGMGSGGCGCTWFHSREGRPEGEKSRPWKERLVREGNAHAALVLDGNAAVAWCHPERGVAWVATRHPERPVPEGGDAGIIARFELPRSK